MTKKRSWLFFIIYIVAQFIFSFQLLPEVDRKSALFKNYIANPNLGMAGGQIISALMLTAFATLGILIVYAFISLLIRISFPEDHVRINDYVYNTLFLAIGISTIVNLILKLILPFRWIAFIYPFAVVGLFFAMYIGEFDDRKAKLLPTGVVAAASLFLLIYVVTSL